MRCADQSAVSSFSVGSNPQPPAPATSSNRVSKLLFMAKHYSGAPEADWEDAFAAPMAATVCAALGGLRLPPGVPRAGIVHRLDKDTSGLLVVARNVAAQAHLAAQLAARTVRRVYFALVHGDPPAQGTIDAPIGRGTRARTRMAVTRRGKEARTRYRVLERFGSAALVECRLETGRTHQIRVHFQHIRHPLVGDPVYRRGTRHGLALGRQALHAAEPGLGHPRSGKTLSWRGPAAR